MVAMYTWICLGVWILLINCTVTSTDEKKCTSKTSKSAVARLTDDLMCGYKKDIRPVRDWKRPITIYIDLSIYAILHVNEKDQLFSSYIWYSQSWTDEFLTWNPMEYENVTLISYSAQKIWTPDMFVVEFVDVDKSPDVPFVKINHEGKVYNYKPIQITTACNLNIHYFPFDVQNCTLTFVSWIHTVEELNVSFKRSAEEIKKDKHLYESEGEWELLYVVPFYAFLTEHGDTYGELKFDVVIKRRPIFYCVNLLLPSILLMLMDIVGYYLPPESGERISFKITLILGYSVSLIIVSDILPATSSGTPLIGVYFAVCLVLLVVSLSESILIIRILHKRHLQPQVPEWTKKLVLEKMAFILCIRKPITSDNLQANGCADALLQLDNCYTGKNKSVNGTDKNLTDEGTLPVGEHCVILDTIRKEVSSIRTYLETSDEHEVTTQWLQIAYILDTFLFWVYIAAVLAYMACLTFLWSKWKSA